MKVGGILYKRPCVLLLGVDDDYPLFGRLREIFILNSSRVFFYVDVMQTSLFLSHYHAYHITDCTLDRVISLTNLYSPFAMHIHHIIVNSLSEQIVVPKYHVSGCLY